MERIQDLESRVLSLSIGLEQIPFPLRASVSPTVKQVYYPTYFRRKNDRKKETSFRIQEPWNLAWLDRTGYACPTVLLRRQDHSPPLPRLEWEHLEARD